MTAYQLTDNVSKRLIKFVSDVESFSFSIVDSLQEVFDGRKRNVFEALDSGSVLLDRLVNALAQCTPARGQCLEGDAFSALKSEVGAVPAGSSAKLVTLDNQAFIESFRAADDQMLLPKSCEDKEGAKLARPC